MNVKQIKDFLKYDYPKLSLLTTGCYLSKSTIKNTTINSDYSYYQNIFNLVNITIAKLENTHMHPYRTLIMERYINHTQLKDIEPLIGYASNETCKKMKKALVCFANEYNKLAEKYNMEFKFK